MLQVRRLRTANIAVNFTNLIEPNMHEADFEGKMFPEILFIVLQRVPLIGVRDHRLCSQVKPGLNVPY